jgi:hypothetical protein
MTLDDEADALLVNGGGIDGGSRVYFANAGLDWHAVGSLQPLAPVVGCIVIRPDGSRVLARVERDPFAEQPDSYSCRSGHSPSDLRAPTSTPTRAPLALPPWTEQL